MTLPQLREYKYETYHFNTFLDQCSVFLLHYFLAAVKSTYSISQAPSAGMPSASCPGWTAAAQPPAQSNNQDPAPLASATACFPQLVWQSHHWNERHRSAELSEDPPAGEEQVGCLHCVHKLEQLREMPDLSKHKAQDTAQTLKLVVVLLWSHFIIEMTPAYWKILHLIEMLCRVFTIHPLFKMHKCYCKKW